MSSLPCPFCNYEANDDDGLFGHLYYGHKKSEISTMEITLTRAKPSKGKAENE